MKNLMPDADFLEHAGKTFISETTGGTLADPTLCIRDLDDKVVAWDDDSGEGNHAKVRAKADEDGFIEGYVRSLSSKRGGEITIRYRRE